MHWIMHNFKDLSLLNAHECQAEVKICSLSMAMVTSPYMSENSRMGRNLKQKTCMIGIVYIQYEIKLIILTSNEFVHLTASI